HDAGQAKFGELLPQCVAEPIGAIYVAPMPQLLLDRAFLRHQGADAVLERSLVFIQGHHAPGSLNICLATIPSWISLVPPSIELALERSQSRARLPPFDCLVSHYRH